MSGMTSHQTLNHQNTPAFLLILVLKKLHTPKRLYFDSRNPSFAFMVQEPSHISTVDFLTPNAQKPFTTQRMTGYTSTIMLLQHYNSTILS
mmetsp:Transcript_9664/g.14161  ORF Transcript_9664/g.14161 Transcript_9664/m.14161 type:complete len:91 (-) Transcript_9664:153-425(-)